MKPSEIRKRIARLEKFVLLLKRQRAQSPRTHRYIYNNAISDIRDDIANEKEDLKDELIYRKAADLRRRAQ